MLTAPIRVDAGAEGNVRAVVVGNDALGVVSQELGGWGWVLLRSHSASRSSAIRSNRLGGLLMAPRPRGLDGLSLTKPTSPMSAEGSNSVSSYSEDRTPVAQELARRLPTLVTMPPPPQMDLGPFPNSRRPRGHISLPGLSGRTVPAALIRARPSPARPAPASRGESACRG